MNDYPRLWAIVCLITNEIEYSNTRYTAVQGFYKSLPYDLKDKFRVVRYDPSPLYQPNPQGE